MDKCLIKTGVVNVIHVVMDNHLAKIEGIELTKDETSNIQIVVRSTPLI